RFRAVKSERNFVSAILNTESALVLVLNPGGRVLRANKTYEQNIGYTIDEIRGKPIWDLPLAPGESQKLKTVFKRVQANQSSVELEIRWRTKSDQQRVISWAVNVLHNNLGKVDFVIFTGVDITGQKQLEERLLAIHHLGRELNLLRDEVEICTIALETTSFLLNIKSAGYGLLYQPTGKLDYHYYPKRGVPKTIELSLPVDTDKRITALKRQRRSANGRDETGKLSLQRLPSPGWLTAFMQVKDRIIGVLDVESFDPHQFSADDRQLLQTLADQTAVAIENARLYHETQKRVEELTTLSLISQAVTSTLDLEETLTLVINHTIRIIDAEAASVVLSDDDKKELVFQAASGGIANQIHGMRMPAGQGIVSWVVEHGQSVLAPDVANDPRFLNTLDQMTGFTTQSILCVPLQSGEKVFGAIEVVNKRHDTFTAQDLQLLSWLATPASIAIDNARLFQAEHTARQQAERLQAATATLTSTLNLDQVLNDILVQLESVIPCDNAYVFLQDEDWLKVVAWRGISTENREVMGSRYPVKSLFFQEIKNTGYPVILDDARTDPRFVGWMNNKYARGWMGVPLMAQKTVIGCLTLDSQNLAAFTHADAALAKAFANQATVAIQNARLFEEVQTSHAQLEQLSQRLVEVQETERRRIARELHDEAGQALTSLMIGLHVLEKDADNRQSVLARVSELKNLTKNISEDLHRLAMDLRPASLDYLGLVATLGQLVTKFNQQYDITAKFEAVGLDQERLPATIETNLYRVVQEALTNVVRHAQATRVDILIERRVGKIVVVVEDNGKGFDPEEAGRKKRLGLLGIRERVKMLDGTLRVESSPTAGTTINVEVPYVNSNSDS
ncbi:MAG: GAF domain-containing protein, partial [Chloroflexi bacterium]